VLRLQVGEDARTWCLIAGSVSTRKNALFVELEFSTDPIRPERTVAVAIEMPARIDKGKRTGDQQELDNISFPVCPFRGR
jgi:hypothetical protein